jgi:dihydrofolate reductase
MSRPLISLIAAVARGRGIGKNNALLVHLPGDLPRFKRITLGHPILMGRKTWDSLGRPLPGRRNIVLTRQTDWQAEGAESAASLEAALDLVSAAPKVFVIGGAQIYAQALPMADELLLTEIDAHFDADAFFPEWDKQDFLSASSEEHASPQGLTYRYARYLRKHAD